MEQKGYFRAQKYILGLCVDYVQNENVANMGCRQIKSSDVLMAASFKAGVRLSLRHAGLERQHGKTKCPCSPYLLSVFYWHTHFASAVHKTQAYVLRGKEHCSKGVPSLPYNLRYYLSTWVSTQSWQKLALRSVS